jgi:hypothetical protein
VLRESKHVQETKETSNGGNNQHVGVDVLQVFRCVPSRDDSQAEMCRLSRMFVIASERERERERERREREVREKRERSEREEREK